MHLSSTRSRGLAIAGIVVLLTTSAPQLTAAGRPARSSKVSLSSLARGMQNRLATIRRKRAVAHAKYAETKRLEHTVTGQLAATEVRLEAAQDKVSRVKLRLERTQAQLRITTERLERTKRQLTRRKTLLSGRIVDIYEGESLSYVNVLLGSTDMWTFLTRAYDIQAIVRSDVELIQQIKKDQEQIEQDKVEQQAQLAQEKLLQASLVDERDNYQDRANEKLTQLSRIENDAAELRRALDELDRQSEDIERELRRRMNTASGRRRAAVAFTGGFYPPVSGRVTSNYGYRFHPILREVRLHTGVDFGARTGTPIHAAADGEVVKSGWNDAYGKCIIVEHNGGISTLYGHCSSLGVRVGQTVKKGEVIGRVGSTGWSTGPHLHFEKRVNGKPVRPF